jgi:hypothetical protein
MVSSICNSAAFASPESLCAAIMMIVALHSRVFILQSAPPLRGLGKGKKKKKMWTKSVVFNGILDKGKDSRRQRVLIPGSVTVTGKIAASFG